MKNLNSPPAGGSPPQSSPRPGAPLSTPEWLSRGELALKLRRSQRTLQRWDPLLEGAVMRINRSVFYDFPMVIEKLRTHGLEQFRRTRRPTARRSSACRPCARRSAGSNSRTPRHSISSPSNP